MIINPTRQQRLSELAQELDGKLQNAGLEPTERLDFVLGIVASYSWLLQVPEAHVDQRFRMLRTEAAKQTPQAKA